MKEHRFHTKIAYTRKDHSGLTVLCIHTTEGELVEIYLSGHHAKLIEPEVMEPCA